MCDKKGEIPNSAHHNIKMSSSSGSEAPEDSKSATDVLLKRISGEFSLESIYILNFSCRGIFSLGSISKCVNLCVLDVSSNQLSSVGELAVLSDLEHLDLSDNNISHLDGLQKLENLSRLELAGNKISSFDALQLLSSLCNLQHLSLQQQPHQSSPSPTSKLSNPVCDDPTYATVMAGTFPALQWLDKELVGDGVPAGREFYDKCRAIEGNSRVEPHVQLVNHGSDFPVLKDPMESIDDLVDKDSEEKIKSLLAECTDNSRKVEKLLSDVKSDLKVSIRTA